MGILKPENLLFTKNLQPKLSNFGVSFAADFDISQTQTME
jgi:serine/threonine protein kinase